MYGSTLSFTSSLDGSGWLTPRPVRFTPPPPPRKETRYPLYRRLGGPQGRSGRVRKISPLPRFDPQTIQHVRSRHTDYDFPAHYPRIYTYSVIGGLKSVIDIAFWYAEHMANGTVLYVYLLLQKLCLFAKCIVERYCGCKVVMS
jgi:hypothetical protein